jgi:hypothetical protein
MVTDEEVVQDLKAAIAAVQGEFDACVGARNEAIKRDQEVKSAIEREYYARGGTGGGQSRGLIEGIFECSEIENELRRLEEELARFIREGSIQDPSTVLPSTPYEKEAMNKAALQAAQRRQEMITWYKNSARGFTLVRNVFIAGTVLAGLTSAGLGGTVVAVPEAAPLFAPAIAVAGGMTAVYAVGAVASGFAAWHFEDSAAQLEATR